MFLIGDIQRIYLTESLYSDCYHSQHCNNYKFEINYATTKFLTVRGTQVLVGFAPLAPSVFCAARQNAVLRRT